MRDVLQLILILVSVAMLVAIWRRGRRYKEQAREWYTFIFIAVLSLVFYIIVFVDLYVVDIMNSSDVSSAKNLAIAIAILLYVIYAPHRERKL